MIKRLTVCVIGMVLFMPTWATWRDPTEPPPVMQVMPTLQQEVSPLKSIQIMGTQRVAYLFNEFVQTGDTVAGYRVTSILSDRVIADKNGATRVFLLHSGEDIKKRIR